MKERQYKGAIRVMVVSDNARQRTTLMRHLHEQLGSVMAWCESHPVSSLFHLYGLEEDLDYSLFPQLIVIDRDMSGMNGFEFMEFFEATFLANHPETKVILLGNSFTEKEVRKARIYPSLLGLFSKPDNPHALNQIIEATQHFVINERDVLFST